MPYKRIVPVCICFISSLLNICFAQQPKLVLPIGHTEPIQNVEFSTDGKRVVSSGDRTAKIWNASTGMLLVDLKGHTAHVFSVQDIISTGWRIKATKDIH